MRKIRHRSRRARKTSTHEIYLSQEQLAKIQKIREKKGQAGMILYYDSENGKLNNFKFLSHGALGELKYKNKKKGNNYV